MHIRKLLPLVVALCLSGGAPRAENPRRRRLRHALRQPRIRQQRLQPVADALQRPPHAPCGRRMAGEEPPRIRRGHATELRPAQRRARTVSERRQTADVLPLLDRERAGRGGYLRPQKGADGRLLPCPRQRLGGVLPQPPIGLSGPLRLDAARKKTYVEMAIDWEGMYSEESREMFRIPRPDATRSTADSISDTPSRCSTSPARNSTRT